MRDDSPRTEPAGEMSIQLEKKKQIDAICDRFELAWDADAPPRIEEYLELLPVADCRSLLKELLASELALRGQQDEVCHRADYEERFEQHLDVVAEVFSQRRPESAQQKSGDGEKYFEIIQAFRSHRRQTALTAAALTTAMHGGDHDLRMLASELSRYALDDPANVEAPLEHQLWLWILHTCGKLNSLDPDGVKAVVGDLLKHFPAARQAILIDLLLGHASGQAAQANFVTQRTVTSTILIATKILAGAG